MAESSKGVIISTVADQVQNFNNKNLRNAVVRLQQRVKRVSGVPGVGDDEQDGYENGMIWINSATNNVYILADNTAGAAVWRLV